MVKFHQRGFATNRATNLVIKLQLWNQLIPMKTENDGTSKAYLEILGVPAAKSPSGTISVSKIHIQAVLLGPHHYTMILKKKNLGEILHERITFL